MHSVINIFQSTSYEIVAVTGSTSSVVGFLFFVDLEMFELFPLINNFFKQSQSQS